MLLNHALQRHTPNQVKTGARRVMLGLITLKMKPVGSLSRVLRPLTSIQISSRIHHQSKAAYSNLNHPVLKQEQIVPSPATAITSIGVSPDNERLEKFIPVTRRMLLRVLVEDKELLTSHQKMLMEKIAAALDAKYSKRFYSILEQTKVGEALG